MKITDVFVPVVVMVVAIFTGMHYAAQAETAFVNATFGQVNSALQAAR